MESRRRGPDRALIVGIENGLKSRAVRCSGRSLDHIIGNSKTSMSMLRILLVTAEQNQILSAIVVRHGGPSYEADLKVVVASFVVPPLSNVPG
jgi:hypothetical protein